MKHQALQEGEGRNIVIFRHEVEVKLLRLNTKGRVVGTNWTEAGGY